MPAMMKKDTELGEEVVAGRARDKASKKRLISSV